ncbi:hypothetical protein NW754_000700 [Fusarium falciforme]|nr:hypothetical protein NW754_000700 [Fusarium falciforme]KAJ4209853.1 hypothetical protein NW767_000131 [Fusarium falciforme]
MLSIDNAISIPVPDPRRAPHSPSTSRLVSTSTQFHLYSRNPIHLLHQLHAHRAIHSVTLFTGLQTAVSFHAWLIPSKSRARCSMTPIKTLPVRPRSGRTLLHLGHGIVSLTIDLSQTSILLDYCVIKRVFPSGMQGPRPSPPLCTERPENHVGSRV